MILAMIEHYSNGNKAQFASQLGITPQGLSTWIKRETFDIELIFSKCEGLSPKWLLTGEGEMIENFNQTNSQENSLLSEKKQEKPYITHNMGQGTPYYDVDFTAGFNEVFNNQTTLPTCNIIVPGLEKATVWCNVTGHSMEPKINPGDIIALRECTVSDIQYGEIYAVVHPIRGDLRRRTRHHTHHQDPPQRLHTRLPPIRTHQSLTIRRTGVQRLTHHTHIRGHRLHQQVLLISTPRHPPPRPHHDTPKGTPGTQSLPQRPH